MAFFPIPLARTPQAMSIDHEPESPLTPLGLQLLSTETLRHEEKQLPKELPDAPAWLFLLWLIGPFLLADLLFGPATFVMSEAMNGRAAVAKIFAGVLLATCMGIIPLQSVILNCYLVFSPERWWFRGGILLALLIPLAVAGMAGMYALLRLEQFAVGDHERENVARYFCALPTVVVAGQLPFWFVRILRGWQFVREDARITTSEPRGDGPASNEPLSILHLLAATAVVATCLGLIRAAPIKTLEGAWVLWLLVGIFSVLAFGFSLISLVYFLLFKHVKSRLLFWGLGLGLPAIVGSLVSALLIYFLWWHVLDRILSELALNTMMFSSIGLTFIVGLTTSLWLLEIHGWTIASAQRQDHLPATNSQG